MVSVHIRRTDYTIGEEWWKMIRLTERDVEMAMNVHEDIEQGPLFLLLSDDIEWWTKVNVDLTNRNNT
jgi:hypothetical protein